MEYLFFISEIQYDSTSSLTYPAALRGVAHKIKAEAKEKYISTSLLAVSRSIVGCSCKGYRGSAHRAKGLNSIIKGKKSTYKVKKWQGFSDNHTSSSPTHPTRAYEYFHRGKKYPPPRTTSYEDDRHAPNPLSSYDYDKAFR